MPTVGDRFGDFVLVREVGRGAMGTVWEARQESLGRTVALKVLAANAATDPIWVARFRSEAGQAARLSHAGILPVHAVGETEGGVPWYAMELVRGEDLARRLAREGPLPPVEAARLARDAALALHHAHEHRVVHRDVKPANLMVREDGRVAITDFGLAKEMGSGALTSTGLIVGTPYYMSPETITGTREAVGPRADVYGLGATLYELLVGKPPFVADTTVALLKLIAEEDPEPPSRVRPDLPTDLETVVLACLEKRPERRYPSAKALAEDLDRFLAGEPVSRRRPGALERAGRFLARHRVASAVAGASIVLLTATVLFFTREMAAQEEEYREEVARLLSHAEELLESGDVEQAEKEIEQAQALGTGAASPRARRAQQWATVDRLLKGLAEGRENLERARAWKTGEPATLTLQVDPPTAIVRSLWLPGPVEPETLELPCEGRPTKPGLYRLRLAAEGRVPTVVTLSIPPSATAVVDVRMPFADATTEGMTHYAGLWHPVSPGPGRPPEVRRVLDPYLLAREQVPPSEYGGVPTPPGTSRPGATWEEAHAFAARRGMRLPHDAEIKNAALVAFALDPASFPLPSAEERAGAPRTRPIEALAERWRLAAETVARWEGTTGLGFPIEWVERHDGTGQPWPVRPPEAGPRRNPAGRAGSAAGVRAAFRLARSVE